MSRTSNSPEAKTKSTEQLTTFYVDGSLFGLQVLKIQEVTGKPFVFGVPLAPGFVRGLVNLRGQIATALGLREVLSKPVATGADEMSVVCKIDGNLVSLIVDSIGDVVEVDESTFESSPHTIPAEIRRFITGIYKMNDELLSVLDLEALARELSPTAEAAAAGSES